MKGFLIGCSKFGSLSLKCYVAVVLVKIIYAGQSLLTKASISEGMRPSIFAAYQQGFATLALAPFALYLERRTAPPLTFKLLCKIFLISVVGITMTYYLFFLSMRYASATFVMAMGNTVPLLVFIMAVLLRLERVAIRELHGMAKVVGCVVCLSGAMVFSFYKGPAMYHLAKQSGGGASTSGKSQEGEDWVKGFFLMFGCSLTWSLWIILQAPIQKEYPAKVRLTALQCFFSCIASAVWGAAEARSFTAWKLGWDINLIAVLYSGFMVCALSYWMQVWLVEKKGPLFIAIFGPLALLMTGISSAFIFKEILHWGSMLGGVVLVSGLYIFLWGRNTEAKALKLEQLKLAPHHPSKENNNIVLECITTHTTTPPPATDDHDRDKAAVKNQGGTVPALMITTPRS